MNFSSSLRLRVEKDVILRLHRILKGKGTISVSKNQEVVPEDIIGTSQISKGFRVLNLAEILQVGPSDVTKYLKRTIGQRIFKGELLAYRSGWLVGKKVVISPTDGIVDFLNPETGELRLTLLPKIEDLPAGVYGVVEVVDQEKGQVIIKTQASIIHGMFGSGRVRDGILRIISKRDELVGKTYITPKHFEQILVGGSLVFKEAISYAISSGVSGIITGGINAKDYKGMAGGRLIFPKKLENDVGVSIVVCEGFGSIPIGEDIYEVLKEANNRYVSIDGNRGEIYLPSYESKSITRVKNTKLPEMVGVGSRFSTKLERSYELEVGAKVRIVGNSYLGEQGKVIALDQTQTVMPSGIKTFLVTIETKRRTIQVPVVNIEVIL